MSERQYVQVQFSSGPRLYTYHNDGEPVQPGDFVIVDTPRDGKKRCRVEHTFSEPAPAFATKACVKDVETKEEGADA